MKTPEEIEMSLAHFTGSEQWFKHFTGMLYTEGIKHLAEVAGAYWLIDLVSNYQHEEKVQAEVLQVWTVTVDEGRHAIVEMRPDSNAQVIVRQEIEFTDFPLKTFEFWVIASTMLLKSEY